MNKKLKRILEEEERTERKIEELQEHLKEVRIARKVEEDNAIIRSVRSMKLDRRSLLELLNGIQSGDANIVVDVSEDDDTDVPDDGGSMDSTDADEDADADDPPSDFADESVSESADALEDLSSDVLKGDDYYGY